MTTDQKQDTPLSEILTVLIEQGADGFQSILEYLLNTCMKIERTQFLGAEPYQRTDRRVSQANGFKDKTLNSRLGKMRVHVPQVRNSEFYPRCLEKGSRSEVALKLAIAEMYVQGVSTRRVQEITRELCGLDISSTQVSNLSKGLDEKLEQFRNRDLGEFPVVMLDARYEKIRYDESVRSCAVLIAVGINAEGRREIIGVSVAMSEAEVHWRTFLEGLQKRGLKGVRLIVSDDHSGQRAARESIFPSVPWQRCQFHMAQNAQHYAPKQSMRVEIAEQLRDIFNARNIHEARELVKETVEKYNKKAPDFTRWLENNIEEGLTVFQFNPSIRKKLRTSNMLEAVNKQVKRRTRVAALFPNTESCLRLVSAVLQEIHEDWVCSRRYLNIDLLRK
jgi:putative transposase